MKFIYETNTKKLNEIRIREGLDKLVEGVSSESEKIRILNDWAHHQVLWAYYGKPIKNMPIDIFSQLDLMRTKKSKGWCGNYSLLFVQSCLSLGIPARCVSISAKKNIDMHSIADAWDKTQQKWIAVDPYYNIMYGSYQDALSVYEIYKLVKAKTPNLIAISHPLLGNYLNSSRFKNDIVNYFNGFGIAMRNNFITNPKPITVNEIMRWREGFSKKEDFFWNMEDKI